MEPFKKARAVNLSLLKKNTSTTCINEPPTTHPVHVDHTKTSTSLHTINYKMAFDTAEMVKSLVGSPLTCRDAVCSRKFLLADTLSCIVRAIQRLTFDLLWFTFRGVPTFSNLTHLLQIHLLNSTFSHNCFQPQENRSAAFICERHEAEAWPWILCGYLSFHL